ncbi:MAG: hypothetical protein ACRDCE_21355, partial [Cetobacterium sp.]|uniref:hypothetical protein n=1 Tax=Cetobacterium sp. TaxID=2071632 RepID=UPI003EE71D7C
MASLYANSNTSTDKKGLPNASQFGWTGSEYDEYKQLIDYVNQVKEYRDEIFRLTEGIPDLIDELNRIYTDISEKYDEFNGEYSDFIVKLGDFEIKYLDFLQKYSEAVSMHAEMKAWL